MHPAPEQQQLLYRDHDYDDKYNCKPTTNATVETRVKVSENNK